MSLRKIATITRSGYNIQGTPKHSERTCKVYRDSEWNEYRVCLLVNGHGIEGANYHTDDMDDALDTARKMALSGLVNDDTLKAFNHSANKSIHHHIMQWDK